MLPKPDVTDATKIVAARRSALPPGLKLQRQIDDATQWLTFPIMLVTLMFRKSAADSARN